MGDSYGSIGNNPTDENMDNPVDNDWSTWKQIKSWLKIIVLIFAPILLSPIATIGKVCFTS